MSDLVDDVLSAGDDAELDWMTYGECEKCGKENPMVMWRGVKCQHCGHVQQGAQP